MKNILYLAENRALKKSLRNSNDYEVFVNDHSSVGSMYLNSILDHELNLLSQGKERFIFIYSNDFNDRLYTTKVASKLNTFAQEANLKIVGHENKIDSKYEHLYTSYKNISSSIPPDIKTSCFLTTESIGFEVPDYTKYHKDDYRAVFYINAIVDKSMREKHDRYKNAIYNI